MAASVKVFARANKANANGEYPLYIRITSNRKSRLVSLNQYVKPKYWDEKGQEVKAGHPNRTWLNNLIASKKSDAIREVTLTQIKNVSVNSEAIKSKLKGDTSIGFFALADSYQEKAEKEGRVGMAKRIKSVIKKLKDYHNSEKLSFTEINFDYLKRYERYLQKKGNKVNTITANFKVIRRIINDAVKSEFITYEQNPFLKFPLRSDQTERTFLTEDEIKKIEALDLTGKGILDIHRDVFIFSFYAAGLRISDIVNLKWENFDGKRITIYIRKTKVPHTIKLNKKAAEIISRYPKLDKKSGVDRVYIFPLLDESKDLTDPVTLFNGISSASASVNSSLKAIAELAKIPKSISMHVARHSMARVGLRLKLPLLMVSKLLGHTNIRETQVYAKFADTDADDAMAVFDTL